MQERAAYRGPADAVRRRHQRDDYTASLTAPNSFYSQAEWNSDNDPSAEGRCRPQGTPHRSAVSIKPLQNAAAVMSLKGPEKIAEHAVVEGPMPAHRIDLRT
ncbi:hypothetical protein ACFYUH_20335 [Streptomyces fimicarius]|uniref:hypothetical protein n=1 Tax=Streptomyces griseus TaxID=1911 RepID=UPI0036AF74E5